MEHLTEKYREYLKEKGEYYRAKNLEVVLKDNETGLIYAIYSTGHWEYVEINEKSNKRSLR